MKVGAKTAPVLMMSSCSKQQMIINFLPNLRKRETLDYEPIIIAAKIRTKEAL
jgi:hypothetical protein